MRRIGVLGALLLASCAGGPRPSPGPLTEAWRWTAPSPAYVGMPTAAGADVAVSYGRSRLVMLELSSGQLRWQAERVGLRDVAPRLTRSLVVAATDDGLSAFDRSTGTVAWQRSLGDRVSTPAVSSGIAAATTWDGRLVGVRVSGGEVVWEVPLGEPALAPPVAARRLFIVSWDGGASAVDVTGRVRWRVDLPAGGTSGPAVVGDTVVIVAGDAQAYGLRAETGQVLWTSATDGAGSPEAPPVSFDGRRVVVVDRQGTVTVIDTRTAAVRWRSRTGRAVERGQPAVLGSTVATPVEDGTLYLMSQGGRRAMNPSGRVSGVAAGRHVLLVATREARVNGVTAFRTH